MKHDKKVIQRNLKLVIVLILVAAIVAYLVMPRPQLYWADESTPVELQWEPQLSSSSGYGTGNVTGVLDISVEGSGLNGGFRITSANVAIDGTPVSVTYYGNFSTPYYSFGNQFSLPLDVNVPAQLRLWIFGEMTKPQAPSIVTITLSGTWISILGSRSVQMTLVSSPIHWIVQNNPLNP